MLFAGGRTHTLTYTHTHNIWSIFRDKLSLLRSLVHSPSHVLTAGFGSVRCLEVLLNSGVVDLICTEWTAEQWRMLCQNLRKNPDDKFWMGKVRIPLEGSVVLGVLRDVFGDTGVLCHYTVSYRMSYMWDERITHLPFPWNVLFFPKILLQLLTACLQVYSPRQCHCSHC